MTEKNPFEAWRLISAPSGSKWNVYLGRSTAFYKTSIFLKVMIMQEDADADADADVDSFNHIYPEISLLITFTQRSPAALNLIEILHFIAADILWSAEIIPEYH